MVDSINPTYDYTLRMLKLQNIEQIMKIKELYLGSNDLS